MQQISVSLKMLQKRPAPLQVLPGPWDACGLEVWVKREDLLHPEVSGNKWRKLIGNLRAARAAGKDCLLTFGGAYSNHIYATAAAAQEAGFRSIGVIRGEEHEPLNPTLQFARDQGMQLVYMDRSTYRKKHEAAVLDQLRQKHGDFFMIPEGGSNVHALEGVREMMEEIPQEYDYVLCACGTGGTLAGIVSALPEGMQAIGVSALKGGEFLYGDASRLAGMGEEGFRRKAHIWTDAHHGGYAKTSPELIAFMQELYKETGLKTDPVYTGKALYALAQKAQQGILPAGSKVLFIHTGGMQGLRGMEKRVGIIF